MTAKRAEAAGRAFRVILSATDPFRPLSSTSIIAILAAIPTIIGFILIVIGGMILSIRSTVDDARRWFGPWEKVSDSQKRLEKRSALLGAVLCVTGVVLVDLGLSPD